MGQGATRYLDGIGGNMERLSLIGYGSDAVSLPLTLHAVALLWYETPLRGDKCNMVSAVGLLFLFSQALLILLSQDCHLGGFDQDDLSTMAPIQIHSESTNRPDEWKIEQGLSAAVLPVLDMTGPTTTWNDPQTFGPFTKDEAAVKAVGDREKLFTRARKGWKG